MALDMQLNVQYIWSSGKSEGKNSSKMVKALPTNPQKWLMLDVSDLRNGWWYINFALFSTSYWETMQEQTFGDSKGQLCMSWVVQTNVTRHILFIYILFIALIFLFLFFLQATFWLSCYRKLGRKKQQRVPQQNSQYDLFKL